MSDEIIKTTEESITTEAPVVEETPIVVTDPVVKTEPMTAEVPVPILETSHSSLEPNLEGDVAVDAEPTGEAQTPSTTQQEPNLEARESVDTELPNEVLAPTSRLDTIALSFKSSMLRAREFLAMANVAIQVKKKKNLEKIMALFVKKDKIRNSDVRDLLHIADPTATVYLNILLKAGKIKREGKNKGVYYTKV